MGQESLYLRPALQCTLDRICSEILTSSEKFLWKVRAFYLMSESALRHSRLKLQRGCWTDHPSWLQSSVRFKPGALQIKIVFQVRSLRTQAFPHPESLIPCPFLPHLNIVSWTSYVNLRPFRGKVFLYQRGFFCWAQRMVKKVRSKPVAVCFFMCVFPYAS